MLAQLPTHTLTNIDYRRSRGTAKPFAASPGQARAEYLRLYGEQVAQMKKLKRRVGRSWRWHQDYDTAEED